MIHNIHAAESRTSHNCSGICNRSSWQRQWLVPVDGVTQQDFLKSKALGTHVGQTLLPAIVVTNSDNNVSVDLLEGLGEVSSSGSDIEVLNGRQSLRTKTTVSGKKESHTGSRQFPPGAPPHLSLVICMRPCSPPPPTVSGLQELSCIAKDASMIGGMPYWPPYLLKYWRKGLQAWNGPLPESIADCRETVTKSWI